MYDTQHKARWMFVAMFWIASPLETSTFTLGNPIAHLEKIQCPLSDIYMEMFILTGLIDIYVLEGISSRI